MSKEQQITGRKEIDELVRRIEENRRIIDARLARPAKWRGILRREGIRKKESAGERKAVEKIFNRLARTTRPNSPVTAELLIQIQGELGGDGKYRTGNVRVGSTGINRTHPAFIARMVDRALERATDGVEPTVLAVARLHFELLLIHPFRDYNGRAVRLFAAFLLMRAGYRSTLFTAVEQHFQLDPRSYGKAFTTFLDAPRPDAWPWLLMALKSMYSTSAMAGWFYEREERLRAAAAMTGLGRFRTRGALKTYDFGESSKSAIAGAVGKDEKPWSELYRQFKREELGALRGQLKRTSQEQRAEAFFLRQALWPIN